ncbi:MAG: FecR family protein [bacterium]|nr:FecR family protein [bacterium]
MKIKFLLVALTAVLLFPSAVFAMASFDFPVVAPVVSFVEGDVTVKGAGASGWEAAEAGRLLASGDAVKTGPKSKAEISCATGKMRLYENTVIIVPEVADEGEKKDIRRVELEDGTGLFKIRKRGVQNGFEVQTTNVIAGVKGTLFAVLRQKPKNLTRVAVFSGVVEVTDTDRTSGTRTRLGRGKTMGVEDRKGFGDTEDFDPSGDPWGDWEKGGGYRVDLSSLPAKGSLLSTLNQNNDGDDGGEPECDPVEDSDGNPIYY